MDIFSEGNIDPQKLPQHVAVIMDGNGRWAKKKGLLSRIKGHEGGVKALRNLATTTAELGIPYLTVYAFSSENWNRPKIEVDALMRLLVKTLKSELPILQKNRIRLNAIGNLNELPKDCFTGLSEVMNETAHNNHMTLTLALSYGSRDELTDAIKKIVREVKDGICDINDIDPTMVSKSLFTSDLPDPDLLIRTSGEYRISNFLLWQIAYAELHFTDTLWPDFSKEDMFKAIRDFQNRERRFGKTSEQLKESNA